MSTITLAELRGAAQLAGNFKTTDVLLTSANWTKLINRALRQITNDSDWYWLRSSETLTLTAGTRTKAPGSSLYLRTLSLTHQTSGTPLALRDVSELDRILTVGRPLLYDVDNATIVVAPTPDVDYAVTHRFIKSEVALSGDSDTPLMPAEMSEGLIVYSVMLAHQAAQNSEKAIEAEKAYRSWLRRTTDQNARSREPFRARVRPGSLF